MATGIFREYTLGTNNFKRPVIYEGKKAIGVVLVRLLLMNPGSDPLHPLMGVGIPVKFRYMMEDNLTALRTEMTRQISTYIAPYSNIEVNLRINDKVLEVSAYIDDYTYSYEISEDNNRITLREIMDREKYPLDDTDGEYTITL